VLLLAADGISNVEIAERCDVSRPTVLAWRRKFGAEGLSRFGEAAKGRGPKPSIPEEKIAEIVRLTTQSTPEGATHWSVWTMGPTGRDLAGVRAADLVAAGSLAAPGRDVQGQQRPAV